LIFTFSCVRSFVILHPLIVVTLSLGKVAVKKNSFTDTHLSATVFLNRKPFPVVPGVARGGAVPVSVKSSFAWSAPHDPIPTRFNF
jgi:hypothetical protein